MITSSLLEPSLLYCGCCSPSGSESKSQIFFLVPLPKLLPLMIVESRSEDSFDCVLNPNSSSSAFFTPAGAARLGRDFLPTNRAFLNPLHPHESGSCCVSLLLSLCS